MKVFNVSLSLFLSLCFFAYGQGSDAVYFNGTILTMEDGQGTAQALAVKDGRIAFVGNWDDAQEFITARTVRVDLHNGTLLPGFIDVHGHIPSSAGMIRALDLAPSPYGRVNSISDLQAVLAEAVNQKGRGPMVPILGNGYDDAIMAEHRHPTRRELDAVSMSSPIMVVHASGHASVANSAMLRLLDIPEDVKDPEGGSYGRDSANVLNGKLEENACFEALMKLTSFLPKDSAASGLPSDLEDFLRAQEQWLSFGQTTI